MAVAVAPPVVFSQQESDVGCPGRQLTRSFANSSMACAADRTPKGVQDQEAYACQVVGKKSATLFVQLCPTSLAFAGSSRRAQAVVRTNDKRCEL